MTRLKIFGSFLAMSLAASAATHPEMLVSTDWLAQHLNDAKLTVLHVSANRTAYDAGHIPGARFVLLSDLAVVREKVPNELPPADDLKRVLETAGVSDDTRVVVYGDASVLPATRAFFTLDYIGHANHALLDGGLEKWRSEGKMLTKDVPAAMAGHLTLHPKPELVMQFDQVSELSKRPASASKSPVLLDVRAATDFTGEKGSHIPTSLNANWMDSQMSRQDQTLKPEAELRKLYEGAGVKPGVPVVTYCNSGMQASQSYFTLKYLGYDVKMYDGSMSEWTLKGAPVEK
jgi:thiosulfate/3-mercaptopyruvate sulfurtransferase